MTVVLIVDDESQIRHALSLNLGARGYETLEAATGEDALATFRTRRPDVVLLDIGLPGMDGLMVLRALRKQADVAIIMLTVRDDEQTRSESFAAGADDYITKPFDMTVLVERIGIVLNGRAGARQRSPEIFTD